MLWLDDFKRWLILVLTATSRRQCLPDRGQAVAIWDAAARLPIFRQVLQSLVDAMNHI